MLNEVARNGYTLWGIINHLGNIESGEDHPTAMIHSDLWMKIPEKHRHKSVEYAHSKDGTDMMIRTTSKESLINAMKNWSKLPKGPITVTHDHCDNFEGISHYGEPVKISAALLKMNKLLKEYQ